MGKKKEKDPNAIADNLLQALRDCSYSTNRGYVDRGSPMKLSRLAMLGYVTKVPNGYGQEGYVINEAGRAYMKAHRKELERL